MNSSPDLHARKNLQTRLLTWLGYAFAVACLVWVFHGVDWNAMGEQIRNLNWGLVALAILFDLSIYVCGGWRWSVLLLPVGQVSFWRAVQSIYIGLFANEVLPLRTGEVIRCYLLAHWSHIPLSLAISSAAIERILDGVWLVLAFLATSLLIDLPGYLVDGAWILGGFLAALLAILAAIAMWKHHAHAFASKSKSVAVLQRIIDGLHAMGNARTMAATFGISAIYLLLQIFSVYWLMVAYDLGLSFWAASAVLIITRLGTAVPNAPGNIGSFQFFSVLALSLFDVDKTRATGFSVVLFFTLTLPLLVGGFVAVALTGLKLGDIKRRATRGFEVATAQAPDDASAA
jgi:uncharacterized protein (TIRG00374 family)